MKNYHPLYLGNIRMVKKNEKEKFFPLNFVWQMIAFFFLVLSILGSYILIRAFIERVFLVFYCCCFLFHFVLYFYKI
mgnify:CR=1 FL=1